MTAADALPLVAVGELHAPAGRRTSYLLLVRTCPACGCAHAHRVNAAGRLLVHRTSSCGHRYTVQVAGGAS